MAPKTPKRKLPRPKKPLGQHIRDETRKSVASGLSKGFGVLGRAVAKRYLAPPPSAARVRANNTQGPTTKNIQTKKVKDTSAEDAILDSAKQVTAAIDIIALNATRGFAATSRQAQIMGESVSDSLNELAGILDRLLYQKRADSSSGGGSSVPHKTGSDDDSGGGGLPFRTRGRVKKNPNKVKPRTRERTKKAKARLNRMKGGGKSPFSAIKGSRPGILGTLFAGADAYSEYQATGNAARAGVGFAGDLGGMAAGALIGTALFPGLGTLGGALVGLAFGSAGAMVGKAGAQAGYDMITSKTGNKIAVGGSEKIIHKMTYKAEKVTFKAKNTIEFKSRIRSSSSSSSGPKKSAGFLNSMVDKLMGTGSGGMGRVNNAFGSPGGGGGGGPTPNTSRSGSTPSGTPTVTNRDGAMPLGFGGKVGQGLGAARPGHTHQGVDVMMPHGSPIHASMGGTVVKSEVQGGALNERYGGTSGGIVTIRYDNGMTAKYLHVSDPYTGSVVKKGQRVNAGDLIGRSGTAAGVPHVHYELFDQNNQRIDPGEYHGWHQGDVVADGATTEPKAVDAEPSTKAAPFKDFGLSEGRTLTPFETYGLKSRYKEDYDALPAEVKAKIDSGKPITNEDVAKIRPESQEKLKSAGITKFADIPPGLNKQFAGSPNDPSGSWKYTDNWHEMMKAHPIDRDRFEDRRNDANPYDDDQYSVAGMENDAYKRLSDTNDDIPRVAFERFRPSKLGYALGGADLLNYEPKSISEGGQRGQEIEREDWAMMAPHVPATPQLQPLYDGGTGKPLDRLTSEDLNGPRQTGQTKYQDTQNEKLDHSRLGENENSYSDYLNVTNDSEYSN